MLSATDAVVSTRQLTRCFGQLTAINQLDLDIERGTIYGFLGPNGCGKSTLIRMLTGLLTPTSGSIHVLGYSLPEDAEKLRRHSGYMTQKFSLYQNLTVGENLDFVANIYGLTKHQRRRRISELLSLYRLQDQTKQLAGTMSGGQKQRLALAAAVLHQPDLLFLDEPTSAVDPQNRRDFWEGLFDLCHSGTSILVSTHYMDEAERCHQLAILERGNMRAHGSPEKLMNDMGAAVIEISGPHLRELKQRLLQQSPVLSAAQLGNRLRVLIRNDMTQPKDWTQQTLNHWPELGVETTPFRCQQVRPSLEDVFVVCTHQPSTAPIAESSQASTGCQP